MCTIEIFGGACWWLNMRIHGENRSSGKYASGF